jgi:hypothetical protein
MADSSSNSITDLQQRLAEALENGVADIKAHQEKGQDIPEAMHERLIRIRSMQDSLEKGQDISTELEYFQRWESENSLK